MATTERNSATQLTTGKGRFSYFHGWEPHAQEEGKDKKYSLSFLWPKSDKEQTERIKKAVEAAKQEGITSKWNGKLPPASKLKMPIRDGDEERPDDPAYKGMWFFNASSTNKPDIRDRDRNVVMDKAEVYSGCYGRISINMYAFNVSGNMGVAVGLGHIQKHSDGTPLGGGTSAEKDFADDWDDDGNESGASADEDDML